MKTLDFYLQKTGLLLCSLLLLISIFKQEAFLLLAYGLMLLAAYQLFHFFLYALLHIPLDKKVAIKLLIYPLLVASFFTFWYLIFRHVHEDFMIYLYGFHAISIGAFYTYCIHGKL